MIRFEDQGPPKLPNRFKEATLDAKTNPVMAEIAKQFLLDFEHYYRSGLAPAFFGPPGIGKTHVCAAVARSLYYDQGVPVMWAGVVKTLNKLMDMKDFRNVADYITLKRNLTTYPVVVLDDFGHMQEFTRTKEMFFELVDTRYANQKPTLFTANFEIGDTADSWEIISNKLSPAITRRIRLMSQGLLFIG
jgi:DNA replication protein DnaC